MNREDADFRRYLIGLVRESAEASERRDREEQDRRLIAGSSRWLIGVLVAGIPTAVAIIRLASLARGDLATMRLLLFNLDLATLLLSSIIDLVKSGVPLFLLVLFRATTTASLEPSSAEDNQPRKAYVALVLLCAAAAILLTNNYLYTAGSFLFAFMVAWRRHRFREFLLAKAGMQADLANLEELVRKEIDDPDELAKAEKAIKEYHSVLSEMQDAQESGKKGIARKGPSSILVVLLLFLMIHVVATGSGIPSQLITTSDSPEPRWTSIISINDIFVTALEPTGQVITIPNDKLSSVTYCPAGITNPVWDAQNSLAETLLYGDQVPIPVECSKTKVPSGLARSMRPALIWPAYLIVVVLFLLGAVLTYLLRTAWGRRHLGWYQSLKEFVKYGLFG